MLDLAERHWHTNILAAAVMRSQGADVAMEPWFTVKQRLDDLLADEIAAPSEEEERLQLLGLR